MRRIDPPLTPGRVYRTGDFARWARNPTALVERLVAEGQLEKLDHGLYHRPRPGLLGPRPPTDEALLRAFLGGRRYVLSGPSYWNALRLGPTGLHAYPLVYNTVRSGLLKVGGRLFNFRRVRFPKEPTAEWYLVDLLNNLKSVDAGDEQVLVRLEEKLKGRVVDRKRFVEMAARFANRTTKKLLRERRLLGTAASG